MSIVTQTTYSERRAQLKTLIAAEHPQATAAVISNLVNISYLTGFTGSNGALVLWLREGEQRADVILTDGRYDTQVRQQTDGLEVIMARRVLEHIVTKLDGVAGHELLLAVEGSQLTVEQYNALTETIGKLGPTLLPVPEYTAQLRQIKNPAELVLLKQAAAVADRALAELIADGGIAVGKTEVEVSADLEYRMRLKGSERVSFETIVAAGPNSAKPHHEPTDRVLQHGDTVQLDFGATVGGYRSDMSRVFFLGEVADWQRELYDLVLAAEQAGVQAIAAGVTAKSIDDVTRSMITEAGYGEQFTHSTGHGVGMDVHELPSLSAISEDTLQEHMLVTVEPGVYLPGKGGMRIEDSVVVTATGAEIITHTPTHLTVL